MNKKIYKISIIFTLMFFALSISAQEKNEIIIFEKANELYSQKEYEQAIEKYQKVLKNGYESAELYYNLANSYYRTKQLNYSIYYYEKAKLLAPDDEDIQNNSEMAKLLVNNRPTPIPELGIIIFMKKIVTARNHNFWSYLSVSSFIISLFLAAYFLISRSSTTKKITFSVSVVALFISALSFFFTHKQLNFLKAKNRAIVFSVTSPVNSSPDENSTKLFDVYEGFNVKIADVSGVWYKIILEDGKQGWIKKETLKIL